MPNFRHLAYIMEIHMLWDNKNARDCSGRWLFSIVSGMSAQAVKVGQLAAVLTHVAVGKQYHKQ